ncbi:MAG: DedA family protein [Deltaproteobacteria bacterium]|nr:DedA family protein [Deltaproteobacteria bacterium]
MENIFPPIPADTITAFGAFLVGLGKLHFMGVYLATTFGSLLGFLTLFWLGGYLGRQFFMEKNYRFFRAEKVIKAEQWFLRYGYLLIAFNRFLPGLRSVISVVGGILRLKTSWVILLALLSIAVWNFLWMIMGYSLGNNWEVISARLSHIMAQYNLAILILFCLFVIWIFAKKRLKNRRH